jgi:hypothetical protein
VLGRLPYEVSQARGPSAAVSFSFPRSRVPARTSCEGLCDAQSLRTGFAGQARSLHFSFVSPRSLSGTGL